jgi:predicted kinase
VPERVPDNTILSNAERAMLKRIADRDGISEEEAANNLVKACLARRVKKRTGKNPAKVYSIQGRK